jgi:ElaB/YqjD/DUF883 family membrane-anchored ribosome-binding protein
MTEARDEVGQQQGLADQASTRVQDAASAAQDKVSGLREQGTLRLRDQFDQRSSQAGSRVRSLAEALRRSGDEMRSEGDANAGQLSGQAADRIERLASYLEQKNGDELMRDVESFARRRPWLLAGLGILAGVATSRFMKASSEQRYSSYRRSDKQWPTRGAVGSSSGPPTYGRGELGGGYLEPNTVGADVPAAPGDDPLARDPYASTR